MSTNTDPDLRVLYNASCPICSREIDHYAELSEAQALPLAFDDLNDAQALDRWGLSRETAARRLHVRKDGRTLDGIPAFIAIWREIPRYHWLARLVGLPGIRQIAAVAYDLVLAPLIWRYDRMRVRRTAASGSTCADN